MADGPNVARLNLLLELLSLCSRVRDHDELLRVLADRLKWVLDFSHCTAVFCDANQTAVEAVSLDGSTPLPVPLEELGKRGCRIIGRTLEPHLDLGLEALAMPEISAPLDCAGRRLGMICFASDGTPYTLADQRLVTYLADYLGATVDRLEQARVISRQTEQLVRDAQEREALLASEHSARTVAEEASRFKDQFLTTLSHELRTPLNGAAGWAQMIRDGIVTGPKLEHAWDALDRNLKAELRLVEDLLDLSRIITGRFELHLGPVDLPVVVREAVDSVHAAAEAKRIRIEVSCDSTVHECRGDTDRLRQALWNLLANAVKFTGEGGRVDVSLSHSSSSIHIVVSDTGIGIRSEHLPHVFDRFRQVDASSTRSSGGLGLGLSLVRQIIELHGGRVSAESAGEGQGAIFRVSLPVSAAAADAHAWTSAENRAIPPVS